MPHGAVVLSSQLAILAEGLAGTKIFNVRASLFVGPRLSVVFPQGVQGAPWRRRAQLPASDPCGRTCRNFATRRTTSSRVPSRPDAGPMAPLQEIPQMLPPSVPLGFQGSPLQDDASVFRLVYSECPRSCLMAHSDRGHPSVRSPGPVVLVCHKAKAGGVSPPRVPRGTPSLNTDKKKEVRRRKSDDMNSHASVGPPDPRPPDGRVGSPTLYSPDPSPSVWVISPSSWSEPSGSLPANSDSVGATSRSGVVPLVCGMRMVDGVPGGSPWTLPRYRP